MPDTGLLSDFNTSNARVCVARFPRQLPHAISRTVECILPSLNFEATDQTLVLGDIPLRGRRNQTVLVHQPHLIQPFVNPFVSCSPLFRMSRLLFRRHLEDVAALVVQSDTMKQALEQSYPIVAGRIAVISHPVPSAHGAATKGIAARDRRPPPLRLFYPAAGYPHKNHAIFPAMHTARLREPEVLEEIIVTLLPGEVERLHGIPWVRNVGRVSLDQTRELYTESDALFFPSLLESYGLPLVESMTLGLPIVCSNLPYARWLCGDQAFYFDAESAGDAWRAIRELAQRMESGWRPDWRDALLKLPRSWDNSAAALLAVMNDRGGAHDDSTSAAGGGADHTG